MFYRFSLHLHGLLEDKSITHKTIVLYSSEDHDKRANAALLISLYAVRLQDFEPSRADIS
jgi:cell division cycle 14